MKKCVSPKTKLNKNKLTTGHLPSLHSVWNRTIRSSCVRSR